MHTGGQLLLVAYLRYEVLRRKALPMLTIEFICALFCSLVERACARGLDLDGPVVVYSRHMRSGFHAAHLAAERDLELLTFRSILYHTKLGLQLLHRFRMQSVERASR
jgi:hypothetical protein